MSDVPKTYSSAVLFICMISPKPGNLQEESEWWQQRYLILIMLFWQWWTGIATLLNVAGVNWRILFGGRRGHVNSWIRRTPPGIYLTLFLGSTLSDCSIFRTNWTGFVPRCRHNQGQIGASSPASSALIWGAGLVSIFSPADAWQWKAYLTIPSQEPQTEHLFESPRLATKDSNKFILCILYISSNILWISCNLLIASGNGRNLQRMPFDALSSRWVTNFYSCVV